MDTKNISFSALKLLVGRQEGHLSGSTCRLAYGLADAAATRCTLHMLLHYLVEH